MGSPQSGAGILLIEDDAIVQDVVGTHLRNKGYEVWVASDAERARQLMDQHGEHVRLLIVDSGLPIQSGESIANELKRRFGKTRVLLISGYEQKEPEDGDRYPFLQKPFTGAQLVERVQELIRNSN